MRVLAFVNQKGGVAKTTSCLNVGAALAAKGKKVLLIDADAQGSLSKAAGFRELSKDDLTTYEVLKGDADINDAVKREKAYDLLPTDIRFSGAEIELISVPGRDGLLKDAIGDLKTPYDFVLIDCPPTLGIITLMALTAATELIIPIQSQYMALDGTAQLLNTVELVRKRLNKRLKIGGVVITMSDARQNLDQTIISQVKRAFPDQTFKTTIDKNVKLAEAPAYGKDIFEYAPTCKGAAQYSELADEIAERINNHG